MIRSFLHRIVLTFALFIIGAGAFAQEMIEVMGRVTDCEGNSLSGVSVYSFSTYLDAQTDSLRAVNCFQNNEKYKPFSLFDTKTDDRGFYKLRVNPDGGIQYLTEGGKLHLEHVNGRRDISVRIEIRETIVSVTVTDNGNKELPQPTASQQGDNYFVDCPYQLRKDLLGEVKSIARTNSRLVAQLYIYDHDNKDTLWMRPRIIDGAEFHSTQKIYNPHDPNLAYADKDTLTSARDSLKLKYTFYKPDKTKEYYGELKVTLSDYNIAYYSDKVKVLNTARVSRPFQFLEYAFKYGQLDHNAFERSPVPKNQTVPRNMSLDFRKASHHLNLSDQATVDVMASLKDELKRVCGDSNCILDTVIFEGFSSPEGLYKSNKELSNKRIATVRNNIMSALPGGGRGLKVITVGSVVTWGKVADIMEEKSFKDEAAEVRRIERLHPRDMDAQWKKIKNLRYYKSLIEPCLNSLRMVRCTYTFREYRVRTEAEALREYNKDPEFKTGANDLTLYDCWRLFKLVKDEERLEKLYQVALLKSIREEGRQMWELPANNLAVLKLKKGQVDTTLLAPFISFRHGLNDLRADGRMVNLEPIVTNQIFMYLLDENYSRAAQLSTLLEKSNPTLKAIVSCLGGYEGFDSNDQDMMSRIRKSSDRNRLIISMYFKNFGDNIAKELNKLPADDPLTFYLKAQRICRKHSCIEGNLRNNRFDRSLDASLALSDDARLMEEIRLQGLEVKKWEDKLEEYKHKIYKETQIYFRSKLDVAKELLNNLYEQKANLSISEFEAAKIYLKRCFQMDSKYVEIAKADGDINEELLKEVLNDYNKANNE